jgi:hypothetical protein
MASGEGSDRRLLQVLRAVTDCQLVAAQQNSSLPGQAPLDVDLLRFPHADSLPAGPSSNGFSSPSISKTSPAMTLMEKCGLRGTTAQKIGFATSASFIAAGAVLISVEGEIMMDPDSRHGRELKAAEEGALALHG